MSQRDSDSGSAATGHNGSWETTVVDIPAKEEENVSKISTQKFPLITIEPRCDNKNYIFIFS